MEVYRFQSFYIREDMLQALRRYAEKHQAPGGFLTAIIENDFVAACMVADEENLENLPAYAAYLYNEVPAACWGSKEKRLAWLNRGQVVDFPISS